MKPRRWIVSGIVVWLLQGCASTSTNDGPASEVDAAVANMNLGAGYLRQGRLDLAIERLQRALELNPRLADAHSTIAIAYDQLGSTEDAESHYRRATQLEPNNAAAANSYAVFLCRQNRWQDAESYFRGAASNTRYATPEVALANAGVCARNAGDTGAAERYFREALSKNPTFPDALAGMIDLSYRGENYLQARAFMQRYLDVQPPTASLLWLCFNIERELDNRAGADRCASQLREGFPDSPELAQLQQALQRDGRQ
jgi:type IV pilus assembly protein PilF